MNPVALITGASRGIGRAAAELLAERGYRVMLNYHRSHEQALSLERELTASGADVQAFRADVADPRQVEAMVAACRRRFGRLDVLVNNAGVGRYGALTEVIRTNDGNRLWHINVGGVFYTCRAALLS